MINYSSESTSGDVKAITRQALSAHAGIAASTLNKFLSSDEKALQDPPNPTLEVICKLGEALNVPPALLLLTDDDWEKLGNGIMTLIHTLLPAEQFHTYIANTVLHPDYGGRSSEIAKDALEIARMCGFGAKATNDARTVIAATSQTLPFRELNAMHRPALMVICAMFALSAKPAVLSA